MIKESINKDIKHFIFTLNYLVSKWSQNFFEIEYDFDIHKTTFSCLFDWLKRPEPL